MFLEQEKLLSKYDQEIGRRIWSNLRNSAVLEVRFDLRISVSAGVARLEGRVSFPAEKEMIEEIVRFTEGVVAVENALRILSCSARRSS